MALNLLDFIRESNRIEGIEREPTDAEVQQHYDFLSLPSVDVPDLERFVSVVADAPLRERVGMDVCVGSHRPPAGHPHIRGQLGIILSEVHDRRLTPYEAHVRYELLHPFMDGNGRSGRVLWAWQMTRAGLDPFSLPFLHRFYYQTLDAARAT